MNGLVYSVCFRTNSSTEPTFEEVQRDCPVL